MKKGKKVQYTLQANNVDSFDERLKTPTKLVAYEGLLRLCAEVCDHACKGEDIYLTLGMTRDKTGLLVVITWDGDKSFLAGGSLVGLSDECGAWVLAE